MGKVIRNPLMSKMPSRKFKARSKKKAPNHAKPADLALSFVIRKSPNKTNKLTATMERTSIGLKDAKV
ncbi:MAG: hypothetical protein HKN68_20610 [Saprospiraceae bacterium]|nr:hypothetical protein [Saprospiraceae bacterium]